MILSWRKFSTHGYRYSICSTALINQLSKVLSTQKMPAFTHCFRWDSAYYSPLQTRESGDDWGLACHSLWSQWNRFSHTFCRFTAASLSSYLVLFQFLMYCIIWCLFTLISGAKSTFFPSIQVEVIIPHVSRVKLTVMYMATELISQGTLPTPYNTAQCSRPAQDNF